MRDRKSIELILNKILIFSLILLEKNKKILYVAREGNDYETR